MADIFISYARPDRDRVEKLAAELESEGYSIWWDRQIGGGTEFSRTIEEELGTAKPEKGQREYGRLQALWSGGEA